MLLRLGRIKAKGVKQKVRRSMLTGHAEYNEEAAALHFSFFPLPPLPLPLPSSLPASPEKIINSTILDRACDLKIRNEFESIQLF